MSGILTRDDMTILQSIKLQSIGSNNKAIIYLDTFKIGHTFGSMLSTSILNALPLQKELQNVMTNSVFWKKRVKTQHKNKKTQKTT